MRNHPGTGTRESFLKVLIRGDGHALATTGTILSNILSSPPSPVRLASSAVFGVGAAAVVLAVGLPFLFLEVRVAEFYNYANAGFGYWMATRALPGWAVVAVILGVLIGVRYANRRRSLVSAFVRAFLWSFGLAIIAVAGSFSATSSLRAAYFHRYGIPSPPLSHVLLVHLFDSRSDQKIQFDLCPLLQNASASPSFRYEYCVPEIDSLQRQVLGIDTTARINVGQSGTNCGSGRILYIGSTNQPGAGTVLRKLSMLPYIQRIKPSVIQ